MQNNQDNGCFWDEKWGTIEKEHEETFVGDANILYFDRVLC